MESATPPMRARRNPPCPRLPITMRSAPMSSARWTIASSRRSPNFRWETAPVPPLLDLPDLFIRYLLSLASEGFTPLLGLCVEFEDGLGDRATDGHDVEPSAGALCQFDRLHGRQLCMRRPVSGQQYPCREGAQAANLRYAP